MSKKIIMGGNKEGNRDRVIEPASDQNTDISASWAPSSPRIGGGV